MQLRYVFSELGQGLRRNLSMHIAVILTLFVSLTLVGLGVLLNQQAEKAAEHWGSQLQITVWLCKDEDDNPACAGEVTDAQKTAIEDVVDENPEVADYHFESKEEAFEKVKDLLGADKFEGPNPAATAEAMPQSVWITLKDPEEYEGITSAVVGLDGVSGVRDMRDVLKPIYGSINALQWAPSVRRRSWCSPRCCWSATRSGWPRSPDAARSASCDWSGPRRSTSRCRSSWRRW